MYNEKMIFEVSNNIENIREYNSDSEVESVDLTDSLHFPTTLPHTSSPLHLNYNLSLSLTEVRHWPSYGTLILKQSCNVVVV